ncbi:MAG: hypothetical protein AABW45_00500 [Nanoarchaeota archaeon]
MELHYTKRLYTAEKGLDLLKKIGLSLDEHLIKFFKEQYDKLYNDYYDPTFPYHINFIKITGLVYAILMSPKNEEEPIINITKEVIKRVKEKGYYKRLMKEDVIANFLYFQRN